MKLMIVDDSNLIRTAVKNALKELPLEIVATAADGREALALFDQTRPDLVTLDVTMPNLDGLSCLEEMMKRRPEARVIVVTALKDEMTGLKALKLGARGIVPKPFNQERLRAEVLDVMKEEN